MRHVARHLLTYVCSIQLALPAGWCCIATLPIPARAGPTASPAKACCCCSVKPASPSSAHPETPKPQQPKSPVKPCCIEKAALPATLQQDQLAGELPALPVDAVVISCHDAAELASPPLPAHRSLQLEHCVWLC